MRKNRPGVLLLYLPAVAISSGLLWLPLARVVTESVRRFEPGRIGSVSNSPFTLENYAQLLRPAYFWYFFDTVWMSLAAACISVAMAFPISYLAARTKHISIRKLVLAAIVLLLFLSGLVRIYALALTLGPAGYLRQVAAAFSLNPNGTVLTAGLVIAGLVQFTIPISCLMLVGTIQNVNPRLTEAATALGAPTWLAHMTITIPLSAIGIISALVISFCLSASAFVIPMLLGKGQILFVSNLIYNRFSEVSDYPSGAAISVVITLVSLILIYTVTRISRPH